MIPAMNRRNVETSIERAGAQFLIPHDDILNGMKHLFDTKSMLEHMSLWLEDSVEYTVSCLVNYVRYKPRTNCIVAYKLQCVSADGSNITVLCYGKTFTDSEYDSASSKSKSKKWGTTDKTPGVYLIPEYSAILYRFPNDAILDGLRDFNSPKKIQRALYRHLSEFPEENWRISDRKLRVDAVSYKPERRAVLRIRSKVTHRESAERRPLTIYARFYTDERGEKIYLQVRELQGEHGHAAKLLTPDAICYLPESRALLLKEIVGEALDSKVNDEQFLHYIKLTGKALATLHESSGISFPKISQNQLVRDMKQSLLETASYLKAIVPESAMRIDSLCCRLTDGSEDNVNRIGLIHGDFHPGQVICQKEKVGLIDFDRAQHGPRLSDVANFIAHIRSHTLQDSTFDSSAIERTLIASYESESDIAIDKNELSFWIACRIFYLAISPFRRHDSRWNSLVADLLNLCDEELGR